MALLDQSEDFNLDFTKWIEQEIMNNIPDALKESTNPAVMKIMVDFSMLLMFQPDSFYKDKIISITGKELKKYIKQSKDPRMPELKNFEKLQPYVLRDLPRKVRDNMPVPNLKDQELWQDFKTIPKDKQSTVRNIINDVLQKSGNVDEVRRRIIAETGISKGEAERIAVNEVRHARQWAYSKLGQQLGYKTWVFHANPLCCKKICKPLDGKIYPITTLVIPRKTHPNCNCTMFIIASSDPKIKNPAFNIDLKKKQ